MSDISGESQSEHQHGNGEKSDSNKSQATTTHHDVLVVASKLKAYIRDKAGLNTSANVLEILSDKLRAMADQAISKAQSEGRKTVMDRDFS
jgi:histone H3/H4